MAIRAKLTLTSKVFRRGEVRDEFEVGVEDSIRKLLEKMQKRITDSPNRTGNIYRIRGREHQASARGEPPAILTRHLLNSIRIVKLGRYTWRIRVDAIYALRLDRVLDRPFFDIVIKEHEKEDFEIKERALKIMLED